MQLHLTPEEHELLVIILQERYRELMKEIRHAHHHHSFRDTLREREKLLESVMQKLGVSETALRAS